MIVDTSSRESISRRNSSERLVAHGESASEKPLIMKTSGKANDNTGRIHRVSPRPLEDQDHLSESR